MKKYLTEEMINNLDILAGVSKEDIQETERGIKFYFKNSLKANKCKIIKYHDNYIIEFRKETDDLQGKQDILVYEDIVSKERIQEVFEKVTGIYLSYLGL